MKWYKMPLQCSSKSWVNLYQVFCNRTSTWHKRKWSLSFNYLWNLFFEEYCVIFCIFQNIFQNDNNSDENNDDESVLQYLFTYQPNHVFIHRLELSSNSFYRYVLKVTSACSYFFTRYSKRKDFEMNYFTVY